MATIPEAILVAQKLHQQGQLPQAEKIYRDILQVDPECVDAWQLLGLMAMQIGQHKRAVDFLSRAIALNGNVAEFHNNLGEACRQLGRLTEAITSFQEAIRLRPDYALAYNNLGAVYKHQGRVEEAIECYQEAIRLHPEFLGTHYNLGIALQAVGRQIEAEASYREALRQKPDFVEALGNLGVSLQEQGRFIEAVKVYEEALRLNPNFIPAHNNLGATYKRLGRLEEAVVNYQQAVKLCPELAEAHSNLGVALTNLGRLPEAIASFEQSLKLKPDDAETHCNLGVALQEEGRLKDAIDSYRQALQFLPEFPEAQYNLGTALQEDGQLAPALECFEHALRLNPNDAESHGNRALAWLQMGDFARGWSEYEWRWKCKTHPPREFAQPRWNGEQLDGKKILIYAEQGLGDTLQFIRYATLVAERGGSVIVECQEQLLPMLRSCPGIEQLVARGAELPAFDVQVPLLSLPGIFGTTLENLPANVPYLQADADLVERWNGELRRLRSFKIGIAWQGNTRFRGDRQRMIPLARFEQLAKTKGVKLFSLQKGEGSEQVGKLAVRFAVTDFGPEIDATAGMFMDTAAIMQHLDLVITSDTSIAHLAGALGLPVWVALPAVADWRWLLDRADSPWYPTMRLFRQRRAGEWNGVFDSIAAALLKLRSGK